MFALDTETTGLDLRHSARPFLVTVCPDGGQPRYWEWPVDPLTRMPEVDPSDLDEIRGMLTVARKWGEGNDPEAAERHVVVTQNGKFDVAALESVGVVDWPWGQTRDVLIAGHLLYSALPHDLTSMAMQYLGVDIQPYEDALEVAVKECRRVVQQARLRSRRRGDPEDYADWSICSEGLDGFPSTGKESWRGDLWLPRAMWERSEEVRGEHPEYETVLRDYANADSEVTVALWSVMREEVRRRGLWGIFRERMRLPRTTHRIESYGVTVSRARLDEKRREYEAGSRGDAERCLSLARGMGCDLELPRSGNNDSLRRFCLSTMDLRSHKRSEKTGQPSLDKEVFDRWAAELAEDDPRGQFVRTLMSKRKMDTALQYMEGYERFWIPLGIRDGQGRQLWFRLHPHLNPTGTGTLRWSSANPNEQNISKQEGYNVRSCFGPAPGREWWSLDYQNLELRIPAYEAGEADVVHVFEHPDDPPYYGSYHLLVAHLLHPREFERHGKAFKDVFESTRYKWVKNGNFAIIYGGQERTVDRAYRVPGAYHMIWRRFPRIAALNDRMKSMASRLGYVETIPDRRVDPERGYPIMCSRSEDGRGISPTVPFNYHVQSTAMWLTSTASADADDYLEGVSQERGDEYRLIMQVHDELVLDLPVGRTEEPWRHNLRHVRAVAKIMEDCGDAIGVPTPVSATYHPVHWGEGRRIDLGDRREWGKGRRGIGTGRGTKRPRLMADGVVGSRG